MGRKLYITKAVKLSLTDNCLSILKEEGKKPLLFPLEDIELVFVEDPNATITASLIAAAAAKGTSIVFCGRDYLPTAQCLPRNSHYRKSRLLQLQLSFLPYKKKKVWEKIVLAKITNQISVIQATTADPDSLARLVKYRESVKPGDETNMEGVAAREYFSCLFGDDFIRFSKSDPISAALNYGYGIIASQIIRQVAFAGLDDNIGIWHDAQENAYNLSYDLIEPFRQVIDYFVYQHRKEIALPLEHDLKVAMISLLSKNVSINGRNAKISHAAEIEIDSFVKCLESQDASKLLLPQYDPNLADLDDAEE